MSNISHNVKNITVVNSEAVLKEKEMFLDYIEDVIKINGHGI
jgi:hypothetical protein